MPTPEEYNELMAQIQQKHQEPTLSPEEIVRQDIQKTPILATKDPKPQRSAAMSLGLSTLLPLSTAYADNAKDYDPNIRLGLAAGDIAMIPLSLGAKVLQIAGRGASMVPRAPQAISTIMKSRKGSQVAGTLTGIGANAIDNAAINTGSHLLGNEEAGGITSYIPGSIAGGILGRHSGLQRSNAFNKGITEALTEQANIKNAVNANLSSTRQNVTNVIEGATNEGVNAAARANADIVGGVPQNIRLNEKASRLVEDIEDAAVGSGNKNYSVQLMKEIFNDPNLSLNDAIKRTGDDLIKLKNSRPVITDESLVVPEKFKNPTAQQRNFATAESEAINKERERLLNDMASFGYINDVGFKPSKLGEMREFLNSSINWHKNKQGLTRSSAEEKAARELYSELNNALDSAADVGSEELKALRAWDQEYSNARVKADLLGGVQSKRFNAGKEGDYFPTKDLDRSEAIRSRVAPLDEWGQAELNASDRSAQRELARGDKLVALSYTYPLSMSKTPSQVGFTALGGLSRNLGISNVANISQASRDKEADAIYSQLDNNDRNTYDYLVKTRNVDFANKWLLKEKKHLLAKN